MIVDTFLNRIAGWLNGETANIPSYVAWSSSVITPAGTDTSVPSEYDESAATGSRVLTVTTFNSLRTGAIASSAGDYINSIYLLDSSTGTLLAEALVPSVLHTTTFDLEVDWQLTVSRG